MGSQDLSQTNSMHVYHIIYSDAKERGAYGLTPLHLVYTI